MIFVTADRYRPHLEGLTKLLVSVFPGSTIYQHTDLCRVPHDVLNDRVDAVFLKADKGEMNSLDLVQLLHRQKAGIPVFIISQTEELREEAIQAGASDYFVHPVTEQQLIDAMRSVKEKENAS